MRSFLGIRFFALLLCVGLGLIVWMAESPDRLDRGEVEEEKADLKDVFLPPTAELEKPAEPEAAAAPDPLAALAPESFASDPTLTDAGFGTAFGSGGSGPAIAGNGLGTGASQLVGDQTSVDRPPRVTSRPPLDYPPEAKSRGVKGFVLVKIRVGGAGQVEEARISDSDPKGFFDEAALRSVRQWKFEPALSKGKAVAMWITQKIRFEMD